jgi:hypothetical protein
MNESNKLECHITLKWKGLCKRQTLQPIGSIHKLQRKISAVNMTSGANNTKLIFGNL